MVEAGDTRSFVMDTSAVLALLHREPGAETVARALDGSSISAANLGEVLSKIASTGHDPAETANALSALGLLFEPMTSEDAVRAGALFPATRRYGLSLGDRACLALALRLGLPVLASDRSLARAETGVHVELFR